MKNESTNANDSQSARLAKACVLAQQYYQKFYATCFWSCVPDFKAKTNEDAEWIADGLRSNGGRKGWNAAREIMLCL
jgi:hypothetical protein